MVRMNRKYDKTFKLEAIRLYETSGKSVSQIETELGITSGLLNKWRVRHRNEGPAGFVGSGQQTEIEAEVRRLKRENEILRQERDILKKSHAGACQGRALKYAFIAQHQGEFEVKIMCRVLSIRVSAYYQWRKRPLSVRAQVNEQLSADIAQVYSDNRCLYGSRRVTAALHQRGWKCNRKRVARLMRLQQLQGCERRKRRIMTTRTDADHPVAPNRLQQDFSATMPNQTWLADITYIPTQEGFLYLASLEDVFSRKIVGWAMDEHMETTLVEQALHMALTNRPRITDLVHHSDRGSQFTSFAYGTLLQKHGIIASMSATGNCYDNAMKESFFATLKTECVVQPFATRAHARTVIFEYIEAFYNRQRLHSSLG